MKTDNLSMTSDSLSADAAYVIRTNPKAGKALPGVNATPVSNNSRLQKKNIVDLCSTDIDPKTEGAAAADDMKMRDHLKPCVHQVAVRSLPLFR